MRSPDAEGSWLVLAIAGVVVGVVILFAANHLEGDPMVALLKMDAALIVFGGTFTAMLIHAGAKDLIAAARCLSWLVRPPKTDAAAFIEEITEWAKTARAKNLLALEADADASTDSFAKVGLRALVDGRTEEDIRNTMIMVGDTEEQRNSVAGEVWEAAGGYLPTIGVLGAVLGLIHVMLNMNQPSKIGIGIATAFVATIYGVAGANLIFLPLGARMRAIARHRMMYREIVMEGILMLKKGASAMLIRDRLEALLESRRRAKKEMDDAKHGMPQPAEAD